MVLHGPYLPIMILELLYRTQPVSRIDNANTPMTFIYADGKEADWITNPTAYEIIEKQVTAEDTLSVDMARGGGQSHYLYATLIMNM